MKAEIERIEAGKQKMDILNLQILQSVESAELILAETRRNIEKSCVA